MVWALLCTRADFSSKRAVASCVVRMAFHSFCRQKVMRCRCDVPRRSPGLKPKSTFETCPRPQKRRERPSPFSLWRSVFQIQKSHCGCARDLWGHGRQRVSVHRCTNVPRGILQRGRDPTLLTCSLPPIYPLCCTVVLYVEVLCADVLYLCTSRSSGVHRASTPHAIQMTPKLRPSVPPMHLRSNTNRPPSLPPEHLRYAPQNNRYQTESQRIQ